MMKTHRFSRRQGAALITVLALLMVLTITVAGVGTYAVGHLATEGDRSNNADTVLLEDGGIDNELRYISGNQYTAAPAHQAAAHFFGNIGGFPGTFEVWTTNMDNSSPWAPPSPALIHVIGRLNGVQREAQAAALEESMFVPYRVFGTQSIAIGGPTTFISGNAATLGPLTLLSPIVGGVTGDTILAGPFAVGPVGPTVYRCNNGFDMPTVNQIVQASNPVTGWPWLTANLLVHRNNGAMRQFVSGATAATPLSFATTISAGLPWILSILPGSTQLTSAQVSSLNNGPDGLPTIILPPGEYYFTNVALAGGLHVILDTAGASLPIPKPGLVRIWLDSGGGPVNPDTLNVVVSSSLLDPSLCRIYSDKPTTLTLGASFNAAGCIFDSSAALTARVVLNGGTLFGSVVADNITLIGGANVALNPGMNVTNPEDFGLAVGMQSGWQEVPIPGQAVFPDGTNN